MRNFKTMFRTVFATLALGAVGFASPSLNAQEPNWVFAGTVEIDSTQIAFIASGKLGGGTLNFEGKEYKFDVGGLGIGGIGVQTINAVGSVYNMDDISKFAGTYVQASAGATLVEGKNIMRLSNENGVIMDLKAGSKGAALALGVDGMVVKLKN